MLLDLPEIRKELEQDPSRWPAAVEELMRLVSPNQFIRRRVREDVVLGEQTMRSGDTVRQAGELEYADNFTVRILRSLPVAAS